MLLQYLDGDGVDHLQISLYDPKTDDDHYSALFDHFEETFEICGYPAPAEGGDGTGDEPAARNWQAIATHYTAEAAAARLVELALREDLLPRIYQVILE